MSVGQVPGEGVAPAAQHTLHNKPDIEEKNVARAMYSASSLCFAGRTIP